MSATVTFKGNVMHLEGSLPAVGSAAPDFALCATDLTLRSLKDFVGKVLVLVTVPSLDTPVCDMEVRRFNQEAASLSGNVAIAAVSCDLPFAQARWCGAAGVSAVTPLSDYQNGDFGRAYGVRIQELALLTRAIIVVDAKGVVRYTQLVPEVANEPDYAAALAAIKAAL